MTFINAVRTCLFQKYLTFSGRATRPEFWKFILFLFLGIIACLIINSVLFGPEIEYELSLDAQGNPNGQPRQVIRYSSGIVGNLFGLATLLPWLAVTWRRMHDSGRPGWLPFVPYLALSVFILAGVLSSLGPANTVEQLQATGQATAPVSGWLAAIIAVLFLGTLILNTYWLTRPSDPGPNRFGPNPHEVPQ